MNKPKVVPASITEQERLQVLEPDMEQAKTFVFGKTSTGAPITWKHSPMNWKYEKHFRRKVLPMLAEAYRPLETLMGIISGKIYSEITPSFLTSIAVAETKVDDHLVGCMQSILWAFDPGNANTYTEDWIEKNVESREQMIEIITYQCELHNIMDRLGESLAEKFGKLASMMGLDVSSASLKLLLKQLVDSFSAQLSSLTSTGLNVTGLSMESSPVIMTKKQSNSHEKTDAIPVPVDHLEAIEVM